MDSYKSFLESVSPYTTESEKNASIAVLDEISAMDLSKILKLSPEPRNELEAVAMIFQSRKKSVNDLIDITFTCSCGLQDFYVIDINDLFFNKDIDENLTIRLINDITDIDNIFYKNKNINNMDINEFNKIENIITNNNKGIFDNNVEITCKCKKVSNISIDYKTIISKYPIKNIFEQYLDITQFTHMTKMDVDSMIPFEREIFNTLIQERENKE